MSEGEKQPESAAPEGEEKEVVPAVPDKGEPGKGEPDRNKADRKKVDRKKADKKKAENGEASAPGTGWLGESRRSGAAITVALAAMVPWAFVRTESGHWTSDTLDTVVIFYAVYLPIYLVVTAVVFTKASEEAIRQWAQREGRGTWAQRYVWGTAPGPGLSISMGTFALLISVLWLPRTGDSGSSLSDPLRLTVALVVLVAAWSAVVISFAVAYHADNLLEQSSAMEFPGTPHPAWADYVYFAVGASTTFGATDVVVRSTPLRRTVTVHSLVAFVFNTVILAAVIGYLVSL